MIKQYNRDPDQPCYIAPELADIYGELQKVRDVWQGKTAWFKTNYSYLDQNSLTQYTQQIGSIRDKINSETLKNIDYYKANEYLPQETAEQDSNYLIRLKRSRFERKFREFIEGDLAGLLSNFSRSQTSPSLEKYQDNVDGLGNSLKIFVSHLDKLAARDGMIAVLTDAPRLEGIRSNAEAVANETRAYFVAIERRDLINITYETIGATKVITRAVIRRYVREPLGEYGSQIVERYRVMFPGSFIEYGSSDKQKNVFDVIVDEGNLDLDYIPLTLYSLTSTDPFYSDIPLLDYADLNIEHYQLTSELREIIHTTNSPPLQVNKLSDAPFDDQENANKAIIIGPYAVINNRECKWIESQGHGITATANHLARVEEQMAKKGLGFITGLQNNKTATEVEFNASQAESRLQMLAHFKESAFQEMASHWADFMGETEDQIETIELDKELISNLSKLSAGELLDAISQRSISREFGLKVLNQNKAFGDRIPDEEIEEEIERIEGPTPTIPINETADEEILG